MNNKLAVHIPAAMSIVRAVLLACLLTSLAIVIAATQLYPWLTGTKPVRIEGPSMGWLPVGSLVYIKPVSQPAVGDIVTVQVGNVLVTHRIIDDFSGNGDLWATQGDALDQPDPWLVRNDQIVGKVVAWLPVLGIASKLLSAPQVIAFLLLVAIALLYLPRTHHAPAPAHTPPAPSPG